MRHVLLTFLLCAITSVPTFARVPGVPQAGDPPLTLDSLARRALAHSPRLRSARWRAEAAGTRGRQAGAWEPPQFAFEFFAVPVGESPFTGSLENDYSLQQMIPFPGKTSAMRAAADYGMRMEERSAEALARRIVAETKSAGAMLLSVRERITLAEENVRVADRVLDVLTSRASVGRASETDVLRLQVERERQLGELDGLRGEERSAAAMLCSLLGSDAHGFDATIAAPALAPPPASPDSLVAHSALLPEIDAMRLEAQMNRADETAWRRELLPDFMIRGMYKQMTSDMEDQWALMVGVTLPVVPWAAGKAGGRADEAALAARAADDAVEDMRLMAAAQTREAWARADALWRRVRRSQDVMLPAAARALDAAQAAYTSGTGDFLSFLDAYRMRVMTAMDDAMLRADYITACATLDRISGAPLQ